MSIMTNINFACVVMKLNAILDRIVDDERFGFDFLRDYNFFTRVTDSQKCLKETPGSPGSPGKRHG